jgi:hypothetical protein
LVIPTVPAMGALIVAVAPVPTLISPGVSDPVPPLAKVSALVPLIVYPVAWKSIARSVIPLVTVIVPTPVDVKMAVLMETLFHTAGAVQFELVVFHWKLPLPFVQVLFWAGAA